MTGTLHIAIAMKPLQGSFIGNALKFGVSGLNIDGTRISTSETLKAGAGGLLSNVRDSKDYPDEPGFRQSPEGRWPANVILGHGEDCHVSGTKRVKSPVRNPTGKPIYNTDGKPMAWNPNDVKDTTVRTHADADGMETVDEWNCEEGCPVRVLGEQSGVSSGRGGESSGGTALGQGSDWNKHNNRVTHIERRNDTGTAARYFFQVSEFEDF